MIQQVDVKNNSIQGLVLVPTRELALQTAHVIKELSKHKGVIVMVSTGGNPVKEDIFRLYQPIIDLASKNIAKLEHCKMLVLDEVDKLLSDDFKIIVAKIIELMPEDKQISLFSATYPVAIRGF